MYYQAPQQPKKMGGCLKFFLISIGVLAVLVLIGKCSVNGTKTTTYNISTPISDTTDTPTSIDSDSQAEPKSTPKASPTKIKPKDLRPKIGDVVKDGKFSFKVTKVEKGLSQVGQGFTASKAQGRYVLVHLTVRNIGDKAQTFYGSNQKLIDSKGREFDADTGAAIFVKGSNSFIEQVNPGNSVKSILLFDVPMNAKLKELELHDSMFSFGVKVAIK
ncbi:DUF4352 domain-containing protein [Sphaerimonospora cavernae]|uniref:DUF4352 domain-containing protein n=1 Tax=Sphaerimonospora cavernae TaxID=1740611 RepID=A0ABV6UCU7_9ACTN